MPLTKKLQSRSIGFILRYGNVAVLKHNGREYQGQMQSASYQRRYRDEGTVEGYAATWVGCVEDFVHGMPAHLSDVEVDGVKYKVLRTEHDVSNTVVRIDIGQPD